MIDRGRRLAIFLPVLVTVLVAAVVGGLVVVEDQRHAERVSRADDAAEAFQSDLGQFRGDVARRLTSVRTDSPAELRRVLRDATARPPRLDEAPADGAEESPAYAAAVRTARTFMRPYDRLDRELRRADVAVRFVAVARKALGLRASDYVGFGVLDDSAAVRSRLVPAFVEARDELAAVRVPAGQDALAATVRDAVQYVIDEATNLAASIESGRGYSFSYAERFDAALTAVDEYATAVEGDVTEAVNAVADPAPTEPGSAD